MTTDRLPPDAPTADPLPSGLAWEQPEPWTIEYYEKAIEKLANRPHRATDDRHLPGAVRRGQAPPRGRRPRVLSGPRVSVV